MSLPRRTSRNFRRPSIFTIILSVILIGAIAAAGWLYYSNNILMNENEFIRAELAKTKEELETLKARDEYKINQELQAEVTNIEKTYNQAVTTYEKLLAFRDTNKTNTKIGELEENIALSLKQLSERNFSSAAATLKTVASTIDSEIQAAASAFTIPANVAVNNAPPAAGYSRQQVQTEIGNYLIDLVSGDLGSTRVIVDTASDATCANDCPVLPLGDYASRNGAYAGINGSYFCPASYPSCAGKTNSFDTLLMNKNKVYFNSDNNVYSSVPVVVFGNGFVRFIGRSSDWGRDTGVDGVLANQPLLVSGGNVVFGGDGDPKKGSKGSRSFVSNKGNTVYIGVVHNVTVAEAGIVLKTLGMENALNLDSGGSTALWAGGYKVGPGRAIPNAILFVRK